MTSANWTPVQSSNLLKVRYDPAHKTLEITFHSGSTYAYYAVPEEIYRNLLTAPSKGKYHHKYIKTQYRYKKIG